MTQASEPPINPTAGDIARSALFAIAFNVGTLFFATAQVAASLISREAVAWVARHWSWFHRWCCRHILYQRIVVEREAGAPEGFVDAPMLYVFKHESAFETVELPGLFHHCAPFAKAELFRIPIWGRAAAAYGLIPVEREGGSAAMRAMLTRARAALDQGRPLVLFAEGTRVAPGATPPLKAGFAGLYLQLKVPVVPVALASGHAYPARGWIKRSGTIRYRIGATIPPGLPRREAEARVHAAINVLNAEPRS